jgi:hypothetical protein
VVGRNVNVGRRLARAQKDRDMQRARPPVGRARLVLLGWLGQLMNSESSLTMLRFGMAPISRFFSTPPMNRASVGMLMTP